MKILVTKEEVKEVQAVIDVMLKSAGIQALQMAIKMSESVEVVPQEGKEQEKENTEAKPKII